MNKFNGFRGLAAGAACLSAVASLASPAVAQDASEDVIIVATRRAENLQEVPVSVTAVSGERLEQLLSGGGDVLQLAARAPGLNVESSNGRAAPRFYIRGLGNTDFDLAASQPVSVIMDDIVMENVVLKSFPLFDIQQVEVLRGPQGTLFGRNTPAGIVNIRSVRPSEEFEAKGRVSYGTYGTAQVEGAIGGALAQGLSARASALYSRRDDWIDNGFNGRNDSLGGYEDLAGRLQFLLERGPFSALANIHGRKLEGSSTIFRANIFTTGSNELNGNFDRERVYYDQGNGNPQEYDSYGGALTLSYDLGGATITSITGYDEADGSGVGDVDGGACAPLGSAVPGGLTSGATDCFFPFGAGVDAVTYPGFIPFASSTQDSLEGLKQFTQEIRIASADDQRFTWQVGAYYFDADFQVTSVGPFGFPPSATVAHANQSWAVFAQAGYALTEKLSVTGGLRYTEDEKDFSALVAPLYPTPPAPVSTQDENVSWDVSARYAVSEDLNVYGRIATGFRAPSIQGRDVAFGSPGAPSVADSETVLSYEAGVKADVLNGTGRINAAVFYYTIEDQQFTAIGGAGNFTQLVNADEGEAYGFELDANFDVTDHLSLGLGASWAHTEIQDAGFTIAPCGSGQCTVLDPRNALGNALVNGNPFPQAPEYTLDINARYERPVGAAGGSVFAETDWTVRGEANIFLYDAAEFRLDSQVEGGLRIGYARDFYEAAVFARNITDEENVIGAIDFNNLTGFVNEPRVVGVSLSARFN
ncbi:MAG: TonB-dependent receptor [Hyphomonadaceae bacterium]|nr:TonB-dependent receptor [Hyphomonadaceae bacterium]